MSLFLVEGQYTAAVISPDPENDMHCQKEVCFMLQDLSEHPQHFFEDNATLYFRHGVHIGDNVSEQHLVVANIAGITLIGDNLNQSIIQCSGNFGFVCL